MCILRLSAIGDTCHVVPLVRTLQHAWPATRLTWIIGRTEARLMSLLPGIEFITIDKGAGLAALPALRRSLRGRRFDALLHLQLSLRASIASLAVRAKLRLGFDRARARELQWMFTNAQIEPRRDEHVLDSFQGFLPALGLARGPLEWNLPLPQDALDYAAALIPDAQPTLIVSPCSSHARAIGVPNATPRSSTTRPAPTACGCCCAAAARDSNRKPAPRSRGVRGADRQSDRPRYAAADAGTARARHRTHIARFRPGPHGHDGGHTVIGLYAATRVQRAGPYLSRQWCVDRYEAAARRYRGCSASELPWHRKIEEPGVMDLIEVADVRERLDALLTALKLAPARIPS